MKKRILAWLLCLMMLVPGLGLAEEPVSYLYTFVPGKILSGEGMEKVKEFLDAVQLHLTTDKREDETLAKVEILSYGETAFELRVRDAAEGTYSLYCSLTGENTLMCRKDQLQDFLMTIVQVLADLNILKDESLVKVSGVVSQIGKLVESITSQNKGDAPDTAIDLSPYLAQLESLATTAEKKELDGNDPACPGAVKATVYYLTEEDLLALVDTALQKINAIPVLSDELKSGRLKIGKQVITEGFIRNLFASMHGGTTLELYENADDELQTLRLRCPDISDLVEDPEFAKTRGVELNITREKKSENESVSTTSLTLIGLEGDLMTIRLEKGPGEHVEELPEKKVHQVGEMNSTELWELLRSLGFTILRNAANMVLVLPRVIFDLLVDKLF